MQQSFSEGLERISIIGNTVRLDFVTFSATETDTKGNPKAVFSQRIVMPIDGFLRSAEKMQEGAQTLAKLSKAASGANSGPKPIERKVAPGAKGNDVPGKKSQADAPQAKRPFP